MTTPVRTVLLDMPYLYSVSGVRRRRRAATHDRIADSVQVRIPDLASRDLEGFSIEEPSTGTGFEGHVHAGRVLFDAFRNDAADGRTRMPFVEHTDVFGGSRPIADLQPDEARCLLAWFNPQLNPVSPSAHYDPPNIEVKEFFEPEYSDVQWTDKAARRAEAVAAAVEYAYVDGLLHTSFVEPVLAMDGGLLGGVPHLRLRDRRRWNPASSARSKLVLSAASAGLVGTDLVETGGHSGWRWPDVERAAAILARRILVVGRDVPMHVLRGATSTAADVLSQAGSGVVDPESVLSLAHAAAQLDPDLGSLETDGDVGKARKGIASALSDLVRLAEHRRIPGFLPSAPLPDGTVPSFVRS